MKNHCLLSVLAAALSLIPAGRATAQTFTTLHNFAGGATPRPNDGTSPSGGLALSGNTLYGTAANAGSQGGNGTVFAINTDGTHFATLYYLTNTPDGTGPSGVILSGNTLYGTASLGGFVGGTGTVFAVQTNGAAFNVLYNFSPLMNDYPEEVNSDGGQPLAGVILSGNTLYGTTRSGGPSGFGTVFAVNTDGTGLQTLYGFTNGVDGAWPESVLVLSGNTLYGTTSISGGSLFGGGTLFALETNGSSFTILHAYGEAREFGPAPGVTLSGNMLYGTSGNSLVAINTDGSDFTTLFSGTTSTVPLILSGDTLYGANGDGGVAGTGSVWAINTNGTGFTTLYSFTATSPSGKNSDGSGPSGLILSGNTLYGETAEGGTLGGGTVFRLSLPLPQLAIIQSGTNVVLSWPAHFTGLTVQSTTNLVSPAVWTSVAPAPVLVNGQNTVTNPIFGTQQFYRLQE